MEETLLDGSEPKKARPTFLTVLCILTFIGSGYGIVDSVIDYFGAEKAEQIVGQVDETMDEAMDEIGESEEGEKAAELMETMVGDMMSSLTAENIRRLSIMSLISNILTLLGALLMWRLNKKGFYSYIAGIVILIISPLIILEGLIGLATAGFIGFIGVIFIVLYGLNLKHMS
jgi:hypothetical protein